MTSAALQPDFLRKLEQLRVVARRLHSGRFSALQRSRKLGRGIDFADHRAYAPGDDWKDIDWTLYGRLDRLMVRLAEEETELHLHLLVDVSDSMAAGAAGADKARLAREVATGLAYVALAHLDRVHLHPFGGALLPTFSPSRHRAQAAQVHRRLLDARAPGPTDLLAACRALPAVTRGRGVLVAISDFLSPTGWKRGLDLLRHARFEVGILQVVTPEELLAPRRGDVVLVDRETGTSRRVRVTDAVATAYRRAVIEHAQALSDYARAHGLFYAQGRADQPFEELVLRTMRAERLLG